MLSRGGQLIQGTIKFWRDHNTLAGRIIWPASTTSVLATSYQQEGRLSSSVSVFITHSSTIVFKDSLHEILWTECRLEVMFVRRMIDLRNLTESRG
jgi:hypothetical protein